ncbi:MAG: PfkB family carbohydrate kinase [Candidatus Margulisbacteria bacterium]|jgi:sugar/nucleoside kinase (ribokinase family)|nr:PfkB family carbohydrate kinase [Candidatus Margulisiibacteriota bacterium]
MSKLLIAGTVAYDSLRTPGGERAKILGGSAMHAGVAASLLVQSRLLSVVGGDFAPEHLDFLSGRGIDLSGVKIIPEGKTFAWSGFYEKDLEQAHSLRTDLNVLNVFDARLPENYLNSEYVFLGNIDPELQLKILAQLPERKFAALDTMNFWIDGRKTVLLKAIAEADLLFINDAELRQLTGEPNLPRAARSLLGGRLKYVALKKGENGALLIGAESIAVAPAFPLADVLDPTGAGDSFAGGFMSWVSLRGTEADQLRAALVYGTLAASFNVQGFGCERLAQVSPADIKTRYNEYKMLTSAPELNYFLQGVRQC